MSAGIRGHIKKEYSFTNLDCRPEAVISRITDIHLASDRFEFIPETKILVVVDNVQYIQERIIKKGFNSKKELIDALDELGKNLEKLNSYGFIHGDITPRNLIYDGSRFMIIDLEPCFLQWKKNRRVLKSSQGILSTNNRLKKSVDFETDKLGYFYTVCSYLLGKIYRTYSSFSVFHEGIIFRFTEKQIFSLTYNEVFQDILTIKNQSDGGLINNYSIS
jgi:hypothetical protein